MANNNTGTLLKALKHQFTYETDDYTDIWLHAQKARQLPKDKKVWISLQGAIDLFGGPSGSISIRDLYVLFTLMKYTRQNDDAVYNSRKKLIAETNMSPSNFSYYIRRLKKLNLVWRDTQDNLYHINANFLAYGKLDEFKKKDLMK